MIIDYSPSYKRKRQLQYKLALFLRGNSHELTNAERATLIYGIWWYLPGMSYHVRIFFPLEASYLRKTNMCNFETIETLVFQVLAKSRPLFEQA